MQCLQSQHQNKPTARFCGACGATTVPRCPSCGEEGEPQVRFCAACSVALAGSARLLDMDGNAVEEAEAPFKEIR